MSTLVAEPLATRVLFDTDTMWVDLADGRQLGVPLAYFPRLLRANPADRDKVVISGGGSGLHWDEIDEDIAVAALMMGVGNRFQSSGESLLDFAIIMVLPRQGEPPFIERRSGRYFLNLGPGEGTTEQPSQSLLTAPAEPPPPFPLGESIEESCQALERVLLKAEGERMFRGVFLAFRSGLTPSLVARVVLIPFNWRQSHYELKGQYGSSPSREQRALIADYGDASARLANKILELLSYLKTKPPSSSDLSNTWKKLNLVADEVDRCLQQTLSILESFKENWEILKSGNTEIPKSFRAFVSDFASEPRTSSVGILAQWIIN
jgi:Protein of unknown function (DUF2442)